jgi:hypothetical protein
LAIRVLFYPSHYISCNLCASEVPEVDDVSPAREVGKVAAGVVQSAASVNGAAAGLQRLRNSVSLFNDKNQQFLLCAND